MGRRKNRDQFNSSAIMNNRTWLMYFDMLYELAVSSFKWDGLPMSVDERYMEITLFDKAAAVYFKDEIINEELCLDMIPAGQFDCYGNPVVRRAYSGYNNYNKLVSKSDSVIIWNNYMRTSSRLPLEIFAKRLYNMDRIIDVNINAQKTPVLIQGSEKQRLTLKNLYMQYDGNMPFIFGDESLNRDAFSVLKTDAPFVADKIYAIKEKTWNEALTYLGISNVSVEKKERLVKDEVERNQGGTVANRRSRLGQRQWAAEQISEMFQRDVSVDYWDGLPDLVESYSEQAFGLVDSRGGGAEDE